VGLNVGMLEAQGGLIGLKVGLLGAQGGRIILFHHLSKVTFLSRALDYTVRLYMYVRSKYCTWSSGQ
jgi:hypothetical protein